MLAANQNADCKHSFTKQQAVLQQTRLTKQDLQQDLQKARPRDVISHQ
jgi:hypothetical protein